MTWMSVGAEKPPWERVAPYSSTTKTLWHQWCRLSLCDGILYRAFYSPDGLSVSQQLVVPFRYRVEFIRLAHENMTGGHLGRNRTEAQVQKRAYWPGWTEDVRRYLRTCRPCTQYHRGPPPRLAQLKPMLVGEPFERISIDITGPHPRSSKGHVFLLTVMDHFSKWAEAIPLRNHTASTVARALMVNIFSRFGVPLQLLSDRGPEFEGALFQELCRWMEIDKVRTTAYRPSTNGMVERYHRTLNSILGKIISGDQRDWCERVPVAAAAYRASVHEATGYTPNRLMLNREVYAPIDIVVGPPPGDVGHRESADEFVARQQRIQRETYAAVREHLQVSASRRKRQYDVRVKERQFQAGSWVWYYYPRRYLRKSPKWQKMYVGPYLITKILPPSNAVLQKSKRGRPFVTHFDKLKLFHGSPPASWSLTTAPADALERADEGGQDGCVFSQPNADADRQQRRNDDQQDVGAAGDNVPEHGGCENDTAIRPPLGDCDDLDRDIGTDVVDQLPDQETVSVRSEAPAIVPTECDTQRPSRVRRRPRKMVDYVLTAHGIQYRNAATSQQLDRRPRSSADRSRRRSPSTSCHGRQRHRRNRSPPPSLPSTSRDRRDSSGQRTTALDGGRAHRPPQSSRTSLQLGRRSPHPQRGEAERGEERGSRHSRRHWDKADDPADVDRPNMCFLCSSG